MIPADIQTVIPRCFIGLGIDPALRMSLARMADGRVLVIDYFASRRCSVTIGDLTCHFADGPPGPGFVELAGIDGVRVFVEARLLAVLAEAGPTLRLAGPTFARHLSVDLDRPERWLDFLDEPGVLAGKRLAVRWRHDRIPPPA